LLDPLLESSSLIQSDSESLETDSQSVGQTVRLGLEPILVFVTGGFLLYRNRPPPRGWTGGVATREGSSVGLSMDDTSRRQMT
jgi:hypothetical protein